MISGPASYLPTVEEFVAHWNEVNAVLGTDNFMVVAGGIGVGDLEDERDNLESARDKVTDAAVERVLARELLNTQIAALQARMVEFNGRIRADLPGSAYARSLPEAFAMGNGEATVLEGLRTIAKLWSKVNAITGGPGGLVLPLKLREDYALAAFNADREALRDAYRALTDAEVDLKVNREERNDLQDVIYAILKSYRLKVPTVFAPGNALVESLPRLTPETGRTPAPVVAVGAWDVAEEKAKITWAASTDADLKEYQVRGVPGDDYQTEDEAVLATVLAGGSREVFTPFALAEPGVTAGFKVYVLLKSGHERGSEAVFVTRPEA